MVYDYGTLLWRVVLQSLVDNFLHLVADDDVPAFNYVVGDLAQYLYTDSAGNARVDGRDDDAQDDTRDDDAQDDSRDDDAKDYDAQDDARDDDARDDARYVYDDDVPWMMIMLM